MNEKRREHDPLHQLMRNADRPPAGNLQELSRRLHTVRARRDRRAKWLTAFAACCLVGAVVIGVAMNSGTLVGPETKVAESITFTEQDLREIEATLNVDFERQLSQLRFEKQQLDLIEIRIEATKLARQTDSTDMRNALLVKASRDVAVPDLTELGF